MLALRLTQIDYDRQMALVLTDPGIAGTTDIYAMARLLEDPDRTRAELAIGVSLQHSGRGIGTLLVTRMLAYARARGIGELLANVDPQDTAACALFAAHGFVPSETPARLRLSLS